MPTVNLVEFTDPFETKFVFCCAQNAEQRGYKKKKKKRTQITSHKTCGIVLMHVVGIQKIHTMQKAHFTRSMAGNDKMGTSYLSICFII